MDTATKGYFQEVLTKITPSAAEKQAALDRAGAMVELIDRRWHLRHSLVIGSAARSTSIRRFSDVDILVCIGDWAPSSDLNPITYQHYGLLEIFTENGFQAEISDNAVRINFNTGPCVDILIAFQSGATVNGDHIYRIPSQDGGRWQEFIPEELDRTIRSRSAKLGGGFKALIRLVKWWSGLHRRPMTSHQIETRAIQAFSHRMPELPEALGEFYELTIRDSHMKPERELLRAREKSRLALREVEAGDLVAAVAAWRCLFDDQ